jgi:hypothetical protein
MLAESSILNLHLSTPSRFLGVNVFPSSRHIGSYGDDQKIHRCDLYMTWKIGVQSEATATVPHCLMGAPSWPTSTVGWTKTLGMHHQAS